MKFLLIFIFISLTLAEPREIYRFGTRKSEDRALAFYHEKQGPFSENQSITFRFEHQLNEKYFTSFSLVGEYIYGGHTIGGSADTVKAYTTVTIPNSLGHELWFTVYGYDYSPGPIYPQI